MRDFSNDNVPAKSQFGNNLTKRIFKLLYKTDISDTQTGLRAIPLDFMSRLLSVPGERFEFETRMLIHAIEEKVSILEIGIETVYDSKENHSTHFRPIVDSVRIYKIFGETIGKYCISSLSSSVLDIVLFQMLCFGLAEKTIWYVAISTILARIVSAIYNYTVNYRFVFKSKKGIYSSGMRYFALAIVQMTCSAVLTTVFCEMLLVSSEFFVKIPVDTLLFFLSYYIQKKVVF